MMPAWIERMLEGMGIPGAIIFVLLLTCMGLVAYVRSMQVKADKVYGYRLAERDTLNKVITDTANVLGDLLKAQEERNDLTSEQAELIQKMSQAFELLKVTILAQYENIRDHNNAAASAVTAMADAIRSLTVMITENRLIAATHVQDVRATLQTSLTSLEKSVNDQGSKTRDELRSLLGNVTVVHRRRRPIK